MIVGPVRDSPQAVRRAGAARRAGDRCCSSRSAVSAAVCFVLARYLVAPVDRLRLATRQLASGDLERARAARASASQTTWGCWPRTSTPWPSGCDSCSRASSSCCATSRTSCARRLRGCSWRCRWRGATASATERHLARAGLEADRLELLMARTLQAGASGARRRSRSRRKASTLRQLLRSDCRRRGDRGRRAGLPGRVAGSRGLCRCRGIGNCCAVPSRT